VTGVTVGTNGIVTAQFSNGISQNVYQIPIATSPIPMACWRFSGQRLWPEQQLRRANINQAGSGGAGTVASNSLGRIDGRPLQ